MFTLLYLILKRSVRIALPCCSFLLTLSITQLSYAQNEKPSAPANTPEVTALVPGAPIEREISGGQIHIYQINPAKDQFVGVAIQQRGIDVAEKVFAPDGKLVLQFNLELRPAEAETANFVAETSGIYRLEIKPRVRNANGRYEIRVTEMRAATDQDRLVNEAHRLNTEAEALEERGAYDQASLLAERGLELSEKAFGPNHILVAYASSQVGFLQRLQGAYTKAEASLQRALTISQKELGPDHPQTADSIHRLGLLYRSMSEYGKAIRMQQQALEMREKALGPEDPIIAQYLVSLAAVHFDFGDRARAEEQLERALAIAEKTRNLDDLWMARAFNNLGDLRRSRGDYERGEQLLQRALETYEKQLGPDHPYAADVLQNLGILFREKKDYARALQVYSRALAIREKVLGPSHPNVGSLLNNISNIHKANGDYTKALELQQRARTIAEQSAGPFSGLLISTLGNTAAIYAAQGDIANAITFQTRVDKVVETSLELDLAVGSERQKLAQLDAVKGRTDRTISLHVDLAPTNRAAGDLAMLVLLQRKGRVQDAMSGSLAALRERFNAEDQKLLDELNSTTTKLAKLGISGPGKLNNAEYQKQLGSLANQKEKLEAEISHRSAEFRAQSHPVTLAAVQALVPHNSVLIEFATYRPFDPKAQSNNEAYGKPRYVAYVLRQQGEVQWKDLGEAQTIDASVQVLRQALRDPARSDMRDLARAVYERVVGPIRPLLGTATQLLISPDGELNLIPFEALVDDQGNYLINRYAFSYLTSGRDLLRMQFARESKRNQRLPGNALVVANPSFGEPVLEVASAQSRPATNRPLGSVTSARSLSEVYFAPLGGTELEARTIKNQFPNASLLVGERATETALKQTSSPRILHIATHGFFLTAPSPPMGPRGSMQNPLLRSGLALANANRRSNSGDDGILTALEASGLNLWGTKLVVLSACDTGLGQVRNGEGVYGLRRAFVLAGAQSLVMSLWPVSDYPTKKLMTEFYQNLKQGMGRGTALRQAQLKMVKADLHPFYWANFIQSGEWANLDGKR